MNGQLNPTHGSSFVQINYSLTDMQTASREWPLSLANDVCDPFIHDVDSCRQKFNGQSARLFVSAEETRIKVLQAGFNGRFLALRMARRVC